MPGLFSPLAPAASGSAVGVPGGAGILSPSLLTRGPSQYRGSVLLLLRRAISAAARLPGLLPRTFRFIFAYADSDVSRNSETKAVRGGVPNDVGGRA